MPGFSSRPLSRFPLKLQTELGEEKRCLACCELWPADLEFFASQPAAKDRLSSRCLACIREKSWGSVPYRSLPLIAHSGFAEQ
ncbi:hypothetical protein [Janthinobacterium sp. HLX7-2]|uniref:hypothetical protein n=1 Tax=Janthinobacterium sp. HLX7-2 TaxID=1259331 RepID=UPI003F29F423